MTVLGGRIGQWETALLRRWTKDPPDSVVEMGEIRIRTVRDSSQATITAIGRVTVDSSPCLRAVLLRLLRRGGPPILVVDLSGVGFLDTSGVATLLEALKTARENSVRLRLVGLSGQVRMLAEVTHLREISQASGSEVDFL